MSEFADFYLRGTCFVEIEGEPETKSSVSCHLCLEDQRLKCICWLPIGKSLDIIRSEIIVSGLTLHTPRGDVVCTKPLRSFATKVSGASTSIYETPLKCLMGLQEKLSTIELLVRGAIDFKTPFQEDDELVFVPGLDLGRFQLNERLLASGSKYSFSILGSAVCDPDITRIALSCALGAPAWLICKHSKDDLTVILSNFENIIKARPIIRRGDDYISWDMSRENFAQVFNAAIAYQENNSAVKNRSFHNAALILLEGRSLRTGSELRAMAAFHFLEWIDRTRRLSVNALGGLLNITREEADAIKRIRDDFTHNQDSLRSSTEKHFGPLLIRKELAVSAYARYNPTTDFLNFLHSICADLLMREIGYAGATEPYFSLRHGD